MSDRGVKRSELKRGLRGLYAHLNLFNAGPYKSCMNHMSKRMEL